MKVQFNNVGIGAIAICSVLDHSTKLSVASMTLILPLVTHKDCLDYLARSSTKIKSIEKLIAEKTTFFSNFNARYYDSLCLSFSSIQYLTEMGYAEFKNDFLIKTKALKYDKEMGDRAKKIFLASSNISEILSENESKLFLNFRIEL